ncbi:phosphoribosylanthranilate isomerase [Pseudoduganella plicata]|uniref:N-(5'-phosphoribosyl)anthranilate isomerase n=1 Tax=Pseudoduganella plicata TaxID=321984 RepID=A0A4P7BDH3_9BURK|nr:phosphoribosylanthranilate isomerase [Pseudoduganella plicata]QBQ36260.1 phosphoribosylanthranilate isomerase [Pseudoduganella plicata]GGY76524.1 N-(5'-phosphoribosyl)anthranilate isomerase [Pseudoduganella plicata]
MQRTRIKICGLTREEDVQAAVAAGADAVGFVFYPKSPRYVTPQRAAELIALLPPFVTAVGLFVNAPADEVAATVAAAPVGLLQFHGDETAQQCAAAAAAVNRPFVRVFRVKGDTVGSELLEYETQCRASSPLFAGVLLDTFVDAYGGAGKVFDWSLVPKDLAHRAVLSGGLSVHNVTGAVASMRPYAVDVSSGVEAARGIKDARLIAQFIAAVRAAESISTSGQPAIP